MNSTHSTQQPGPSTGNVSSSSPTHMQLKTTIHPPLSMSFTWRGDRTKQGFDYQKQLTSTLFVAASLEECRFRLASEMEQAGKFDDAVLLLDDQKEVWFFQVKRSDGHAEIEYKEFFPTNFDTKNPLSLPIYIQSFMNVSKKSEFKNYKKQFIIFTDKSIDDNTRIKLRDLFDIESWALNDSLRTKMFGTCNGKNEKLVPKAQKIQELLKEINKLPVDVKDAIIELQNSGKIKNILRKYLNPLRSILKIDNSIRFADTFTRYKDDINQQWLWNELHTHFITSCGRFKDLSEVVFSSEIDKRQLNNKPEETSFPRFIEESDLRSFFDCFALCTGQPKDLYKTKNSIIKSFVDKCVHDKDRSLFSNRNEFYKILEDEFEEWYKITNINNKKKPYLSSDEGNECIRKIEADLRRSLQKITEADFSDYVERKLILQNGHKNITEDKFTSMLKQSPDRNDYYILVGEAGMGKTTFMKKITYLLQADYNNHVYLICLNGLFKNYEEQNDIFTLMKSSHFTRSTQKFIQNSLENCPEQCFILLDGFDEIDTQHQSLAIKLIKETFCKNDIRLLISGRNHVKNTLEKGLQVKTLKLVPLVEDEQLMFLRNYWDISSEISQKDLVRFQIFAKRLLELLHDSIKSVYFHFTGLPLMVRMLAEVKKEKFEKYWTSTHGNITEILNMETHFSVVSLYENFVKISFNIFAKKVKKEEAYATVESKIDDFFKDNFTKFDRAHQIIAIEQLNVPELRKILSNNDTVTILESMQKILDYGEKSLLINASNKNHLQFTHLSYAEYFLSKFLYDHVLDWKAILFDVLNKHTVVRAFFFSMIEENWDNSKSQMDAINRICHKTPAMMYLVCFDGYELILKELLNHHEAKQLLQRRELDKKVTLLHVAVQSRKENILRLVLCDHQFGDCTHHEASNNTMEENESEIDINTPDSEGALPIHYAVSDGNEGIVNMLAQHGADKSINAQDRHGNTPLHNAADVGIVKLLIHKYSADYKIANRHGQTLIHLAAQSGNMKIVQMLIDDFAADVNVQDNYGNTPLLLAASWRQWETVKMLIDKDSEYCGDYKIANNTGTTLFDLAIIAGEIEIVQMLIDDHAADVDVRICYRNTPLLLAARNNKWEIVKMLIDRKCKYSADYKIGNGIERTVIHLAAERGNMEIVQMLIDDYAADINTQDNDGNTPLLVAAKNDVWGVVKMLIDKKSKYFADYKIANNDGQTIIHFAALRGNMEIVQMLIDDYAADVNAQDNDGNTPVLLAAKQNDWRMVQMLIDKDSKYFADYKIANDDGQTLIHFAALSGNMEIVQMLIENYAADVNAQDNDGNTPVLLAAKQNDWRMVQMLIDKDSKYFADYKIANKNGKALIHFAAKAGYMGTVKMLIESYAADVNAQDNDGNTPVLVAAKNNEWEMVKMLIDKDSKYFADYKIANKNGETLIHFAARDNMEMVKILIDDYAADVNAQDNDGNTPLHVAAKHSEWEEVKKLIGRNSEYFGNYKIANDDGQTLYNFAEESGNMEIVQMLIDDYAADVNAQDNDGNTPLLLAAKIYKWEMVKMLIDKDSKYSADYKIANNAGQTLIHFAAESGNMEIVQMLIDDYAADVNAQDNDGNTPLLLAVKRYKWEMVKMLIDKDFKYSADYKIANNAGQTLIHFAAEKGGVEIVKMLIENYAADVNAQDNDGNTPVLLAAKQYDWKMVKILIDKESEYFADHKIVNKNGETLIHFAARNNMNTVKMLIDDYAVDVNAQDNDGNTPLLLAAKRYKWEMVKMLIDKDSKYSADYKISNNAGQTLIHFAAESGNMEIVQMLIDDYAADVNAQDNDGNTPLLLAAKNDKWEMVKMLIDKDFKYSADYKIANKAGQTLIHLAAEGDNMEMVQMLIDVYAADVNAQDNDGNTPLHCAAENSMWKMVNILIVKHRANFNATNKSGQTPSHVAALKGQWDVVKMLLADYALDVNTPNGSGRTLLHLATENNKLEAVKMLIHDHSADIGCLDSEGRTPFQVAIERGHREVVDELAKVQNAEFSRN
ncbi:uncharacterized protein LOC134289471 [Aedes albopictus]|uniref:NACHT domain-containing protein n=2 Tax=Aedes albopictus TaxID=7160 RepID=A0ABM1Y210_AEDAL